MGASWKCLLRHLEDPKDEGEGLKEQEDGGIFIPGAGKAGYDITEKPEPWRRGYWEALMGCAAAAEHLEDRVRDKVRGLVFPVEYMIGPSNPNPKPCPKFMKAAPKEEDCEPAFDRPETYYVKLLTTKGFTTKQRLAAALAYGEYLDGQGQHSAAEEMFRWGLDIAQSPLATPSDVIGRANRHNPSPRPAHNREHPDRRQRARRPPRADRPPGQRAPDLRLDPARPAVVPAGPAGRAAQAGPSASTPATKPTSAPSSPTAARSPTSSRRSSTRPRRRRATSRSSARPRPTPTRPRSWPTWASCCSPPAARSARRG